VKYRNFGKNAGPSPGIALYADWISSVWLGIGGRARDAVKL
jgi:hypothetical protein